MKLLTNISAWRQWIKDEEGRFADTCVSVSTSG
jgi:hypothetical protein